MQLDVEDAELQRTESRQWRNCCTAFYCALVMDVLTQCTEFVLTLCLLIVKHKLSRSPVNVV